MYNSLEETSNRTNATDYVAIMGDWNAVVGGTEGNALDRMVCEIEMVKEQKWQIKKLLLTNTQVF